VYYRVHFLDPSRKDVECQPPCQKRWRQYRLREPPHFSKLILFYIFSVTSSSTHCMCSIIVFQLITRVDKHTFGRIPLDLGSARRRELYLKNGQHLQKTNIHTPAWFGPAIPRSLRPQANALDRAATGMGNFINFTQENVEYFSSIMILCVSYNSIILTLNNVHFRNRINRLIDSNCIPHHYWKFMILKLANLYMSSNKQTSYKMCKQRSRLEAW
jgi:hypothetical protein